MQCQGPNCTNIVKQLPGGHRARKYCSDACRVAAHRAAEKSSRADGVRDDARRAVTRETEASRERQEIRNRYPMLSEALIDLLLYAKRNYGLHSISVIGTALVREQEVAAEERSHDAAQRPTEGEATGLLHDEQQRAALAQSLLASSKEQKYPALHLSGYLRLFAGQLTENDLFDISEGRAAWQRAVAELSIPALLIALVSMQARRALEEQRSIASEHAWREHLALEEARKEAGDYAGKYYRLKEQWEAASANVATTGERSAEAEKMRAEQELERLRTSTAKLEQALAVRSDTVIKRGATIRAQEKAIEELKNQLAKVTDELEHARMVIAAREATIEELARAPHINSAVENAALKQSLEFLRAAVRRASEGTLKMEHAAALEEIERLKRLLESSDTPAEEKEPGARKQQAALERAKEEVRTLYQVSIRAAEEERDAARRRVGELSRQLEQAQVGAGKEK